MPLPGSLAGKWIIKRIDRKEVRSNFFFKIAFVSWIVKMIIRNIIFDSGSDGWSSGGGGWPSAGSGYSGSSGWSSGGSGWPSAGSGYSGSSGWSSGGISQAPAKIIKVIEDQGILSF